LSKLFDGSLYGSLGDLDGAGRNGNVALPPYFPVDRNEAFIAAGTPDLPANALSKYLGLAWRVHKREALPILERIAPHLRSPELQQAVDDILERMSEPETAELVADMAAKTPDPVHRRELLTMLAKRLSANWNSARTKPKVAQVIEQALKSPESQQQGIALAAASRDGRYRATLEALAEDSKAPEETRVAAVEALGAFPMKNNRVLDQLIASVRGKTSSNSVAEAALRANSRRSCTRTPTAGSATRRRASCPCPRRPAAGHCRRSAC
jgi:hypothetical protein